jgi:hypothetical protein
MPLVLIPILAVCFVGLLWLLLASKFDKIGGFICKIAKPFITDDTDQNKKGG